MFTRRSFLQSSAAAAALATSAGSARADNAPGVTDTEIKIGQTMPYSGPASAYGVIGKADLAYFKMINEMGGVNGPPAFPPARGLLARVHAHSFSDAKRANFLARWRSMRASTSRRKATPSARYGPLLSITHSAPCAIAASVISARLATPSRT